MMSARFDASEIDRGMKALLARVTMGDVEASLLEAVEPMRVVAEVLLQQAASGPYSTGRTAEEGVQKKLLHDSRGEPYVVVGMRHAKKRTESARDYIGRWLENGIPARGIPARPWFRPAVDAHQDQLLPRFTAALRKRLGFA
jgi:hypothetical protein